jgi:hypothetical protein
VCECNVGYTGNENLQYVASQGSEWYLAANNVYCDFT